MKYLRLHIISLLLAFIAPLCMKAQSERTQIERKPKLQVDVQPVVTKNQSLISTGKGISVQAIVENGDTFPFFRLKEVYVFPPMKFKNKKEEKFYWRTVKDVKRVLPIAHYIKDIIKETNDTLMTMPTKKERDRYMRGFEVDLYKREEEKMKKLTYSQGKLLIRLMDRETDATTYELIKAYRGGFRAGFYQMFAKMFGADLKSEYGAKKEDEIIERIILLVESGQL